MASEVWCDYCTGFQPLEETESMMICRNCACTVGRVTPAGLMWCEDCHSYRRTVGEEARPAQPDDTDNQGFLLGDIYCAQCGAILLSIREPQAAMP